MSEATQPAAYRVGEQLWCSCCFAAFVEEIPLPEGLAEDPARLLHFLDDVYPPVKVPYWFKCQHCEDPVGTPDGVWVDRNAKN